MKEDKMRVYLDENGHEVPDPTPRAVPLRFQRAPSMAEQVRAMVRRELSMAAEAEGMETFEEADDFDVGDDYDPTSPYEMDFDQEIYSERDEGRDAGEEEVIAGPADGGEPAIQSGGEEEDIDTEGDQSDQPNSRKPIRGDGKSRVKAKRPLT